LFEARYRALIAQILAVTLPTIQHTVAEAMENGQAVLLEESYLGHSGSGLAIDFESIIESNIGGC